jgi:membrane protease YdiL (CAAX protease family)
VPSEPVEPLAPRWHTALLIGLILAVAVTGIVLARSGAALVQPSAHGRILGAYVPLLVATVGLTLYACLVARPRGTLRALLGRGWDSVARAGTDLVLAAGVGLVVEAAEAVAAAGRNGAVGALLPHTGAEKAAWMLVAVTVGFCEEVVYRGYLQTQLAAFTGRASVAVALQAVLFGVAHAEQGPAVAVRFAVYGLLFGALARWRRSLVPGIVAHVGIDLASGLLVSAAVQS